MEVSDKKLKIKLVEFSSHCTDGCCLEYGTKVYVNDIEMPFYNTDTRTILEQVIEHLGYEVEIEEEYESDQQG